MSSTLLCHLLFFVFCWIFLKNSFRNTIRVSKSLDLDQDQHSVGPDLGPYCLKKGISRRQKSPLARKKLSSKGLLSVIA